MQVITVRTTVTPDHVHDVAYSISAFFAELDRQRPASTRYTSYRLQQSDTFLTVLELADDIGNPLPTIPGFVSFQDDIKGWASGPPIVEHFTCVASYVG